MTAQATHPLSPAALTAEDVPSLVGSDIAIVKLKQDETGIGFDFQKVVGYTRRNRVKLAQLPGPWVDSSSRWTNGFTPFDQLGLAPGPDGQFAEIFCVRYVANFAYIGFAPEDDEVKAKHEDLYERLKEAEPSIFWCHTPLPKFATEGYLYPLISYLDRRKTDHLRIACGFEDIEAMVGKVEPYIQRLQRIMAH